MHSTALVAASLLMLTCFRAWALDMPKVPAVGGMSTGSMLDKINKSLADQQKKDGQFEFKTGKAEFASGNAKRISGLFKAARLSREERSRQAEKSPRAGTAREVVHTVHQLFSANLWPLFQNRSLSCTSKTFPAPT